MTKEEKFFLSMRDEIIKLEKRHSQSTNLSSHLKVKQEEMRKLETIEERREKASIMSLESPKRQTKDKYRSNTKTKTLGMSISTMPENQQASRYLTQSVDSITIAQMTN